MTTGVKGVVLQLHNYKLPFANQGKHYVNQAPQQPQELFKRPMEMILRSIFLV